MTPDISIKIDMYCTSHAELEMVQRIAESEFYGLMFAFNTKAAWTLDLQLKPNPRRGFLAGNVMPSYHPRYIRKGNQHHEHTLRIDMRRLAGFARGTLRIWSWDDYEINNSTRNACPESIIPKFNNASLAVDIEGFPSALEEIGISTSNLALTLPIASPSKPISDLRDILTQDKHRIFHNAPYDLMTLRLNGFEVNGPVHDTMLMHSLCYPDLPHSLVYMQSTLTTFPWYKSDAHSKGTLDGADYNGKDCLITSQLFTTMLSEIKSRDMCAVYERRRRLMELLAKASVEGAPIQKEKASLLKVAATETISECKRSLGDIDVLSTKSIAPAFAKAGFPAPTSVSDDAIAAYIVKHGTSTPMQYVDKWKHYRTILSADFDTPQFLFNMGAHRCGMPRYSGVPVSYTQSIGIFDTLRSGEHRHEYIIHRVSRGTKFINPQNPIARICGESLDNPIQSAYISGKGWKQILYLFPWMKSSEIREHIRNTPDALRKFADMIANQTAIRTPFGALYTPIHPNRHDILQWYTNSIILDYFASMAIEFAEYEPWYVSRNMLCFRKTIPNAEIGRADKIDVPVHLNPIIVDGEVEA
jgi:hypothetical protein